MDVNPQQGTGGNSWGDVVSQSVQSQPQVSNLPQLAEDAANQPGMTTPAPQPSAPPKKPSALSEILHAVGNALGGGETTRSVDPKTGAIVETPRSTGSKVGSAVSTLLMGAAAGASQHGPGSIGRSALAGAQTEQEAEDRNARQLQQQSQNVRDTNAANQQALLTQASLAKSNQEMARMAFDYKRAGLEFSKEQADLANEMAGIGSIPGAKRIAHFDTNAELNSYLENVGPAQSGQHAKDFAQNLIRAVPSADGGFDAYSVPKGWQDQTIGPGHVFSIMATQLGKNGKPEPVWRTIDAPEDTTWGNYIAWQSQTLKSSGDYDLNQANLAEKKAATAKDIADTGRANAETNLITQQAKSLVNSQQADPFGYVSPLPQKEALKRIDSFQKDVVNKAYDVEKSYQMATQAYSEYQAAGGKLPTGAQSMLLLSQHLATTFGGVKGSRVTRDMIQEHLGARGVTDDAQAAVQRLVNGDQLSPDQWKAFVSLIGQSRNATWGNALSSAKNQQIPITFLPRGTGTAKADPSTIKLYLDAAGGDQGKAVAALKKQGWQ
jgi:hypothetical protein